MVRKPIPLMPPPLHFNHWTPSLDARVGVIQQCDNFRDEYWTRH